MLVRDVAIAEICACHKRSVKEREIIFVNGYDVCSNAFLRVTGSAISPSPMYFFTGNGGSLCHGGHLRQSINSMVKEILVRVISTVFNGRSFHNKCLLQVEASMFMKHEIKLAVNGHGTDHQNHGRSKL